MNISTKKKWEKSIPFLMKKFGIKLYLSYRDYKIGHLQKGVTVILISKVWEKGLLKQKRSFSELGK